MLLSAAEPVDGVADTGEKTEEGPAVDVGVADLLLQLEEKPSDARSGDAAGTDWFALQLGAEQAPGTMARLVQAVESAGDAGAAGRSTGGPGTEASGGGHQLVEREGEGATS